MCPKSEIWALSPAAAAPIKLLQGLHPAGALYAPARQRPCNVAFPNADA